MTDSEYVMRQTNKERVAMKSGSYARKCGSKSKKCSLPSDHLTNAQLKKLNGEVITMSMRNPMTKQEFFDLPKDMQKNYLQFLIDNYGARQKDICLMLGVKPCDLTYHTKKFGGLDYGTKRTEPDPRWIVFIGEDAKKEETCDAIDEIGKNGADIREENICEDECKGSLYNGGMNIVGSFSDVIDVLATMQKVIGNGTYDFHVDFSLVSKEG